MTTKELDPHTQAGQGRGACARLAARRAAGHAYGVRTGHHDLCDQPGDGGSPAPSRWLTTAFGRDVGPAAVRHGMGARRCPGARRLFGDVPHPAPERLQGTGEGAEVEAPLGELAFHHLDDTAGTGHAVRYFVVDLPDGRWFTDSHVYAKKNGDPAPFARHSDEFIATPGSKATAIDRPGTARTAGPREPRVRRRGRRRRVPRSSCARSSSRQADPHRRPPPRPR